MAADIPAFKFNDGTTAPSVGMGCWMGMPGGGERAEKMCKLAATKGYRHFDTASGYQNEEFVGKAIRESGIPRSEFYIVTKLPNTHHRVREEFEESLAKLDVEYIDLYLMHWPQTQLDGKFLQPEDSPTIIETWKEMEKLLATGKVKSIGVSNFGIPLLEKLLPHCTVIPVTNQVEIHPCLPQHQLKAYCDSKGITLTAYSPFGRFADDLFKDPLINGIAEKHKASVAQILVSWGVQRGIFIIPKSEDEQRMVDNITLVTLTPEDIKALDEFHTQPGKHKSLLKYHSEDGKVFGWTYEQLGWNMKIGGIAF